MNQPFLIHNHTDASNFRLRDAINRPKDLLDYALELGLPGIAITDHATISNHVRAHRYIEDNKDKFKDFVLGYGDEIYLVEKDVIEKARENNEKTPFYHFLVLAKNQHGYEFLKKLTTREWNNSFFYRGMERTPTYFEDIEELIKGYEDDVIFSSSCIGSLLNQTILRYHESNSKEDKKKIHEFIMFFINLVGKENFYLELQPAIKHDKSNADVKQEQQIVNDMLLQLCKVYDLTPIITTDAHYLNKEQAFAHKIYLNASQGDREIDSFYNTTYVMDRKELLEYFDDELLDRLIQNTHDLMKRLKPINFKQKTQVPNIDIPKYNDKNLFENYLDDYVYINKFKNSERDMDRYYLHLIGEGMLSHNQEFNKENLSRIDVELEQIWEISNKLDQSLSSYFVLTKDVVEMMWEVSLVGVSRGSASCFYTNYLLDIVQINAIEYKLPYWRFLNKDRPELADIDLDSESSKREEIIELAKDRYGSERVLNSCTFTTEGPKSTVITATRGYGLDVAEQHNIANLIPSEGAALWSVSDCFFGNEKKNRKPVKEFIDRVEKYDGLKDVMLSIEGLISGRSQHASSVIFYPRHYLDVNAKMKTTKGLEVTQFNAEDGQYTSELKLDFLSISALGRIREAMELLLEDGKIEWQGSLKETYDKYFHPDVLDLTSKEMFNMLSEGEIFDAFQMSSLVAENAMKKIRPETFNEIEVTNTLIRLQVDGGKEQPVDKFVRYKNNINEWYKDMENHGLNETEIELMKEHLLERNGILDTQEGIMLIVMDKRIGNSNLLFANKYRKAIAKKNEKAIEECERIFTKNILDNGHSKEFADYIINEQIGLSRKYSFSRPHVSGYTLVLMIEMNIAYKYGVGYWKTACLNINSGLEGDLTKGTDYTEVSKAVNSMRDSITLPNINKSQLKFTAQDGKVLYGLKPIIGLDTNTLDAIIENRPFKSLKDYYERMVDTKLTSTKKTISLIKSGAMDSLEELSRRHIMAELVKLEIPQKEKVTMSQLDYYRNIIPDKYDKLLALHDFRSRIKGRNKEPMNEEIEKIFIQNYSKHVDYTLEDELVIDIKSFEKYYNKEIKPLKEEIKKPQYAEEFTKKKRQEYWLKECQGTIPEWEIDTILFNSNDFVIDNKKVNERFKLSNFNELKNNPILGRNKRGFVDYEISAISGVVVGNNHVKRIVYLLTENSGVVPIKVSRKNYTIYQEKTANDESWWERGNLLVILGYKSGAAFNMRGNNIYRKPVIKIEKIKGEYHYRNEKR
ncbi:DNA polymerase [Staphylococcus phage S-CoN_Ph10]|nr:DNA polymerase [Staphylococcus phage S-CoN_Ph10]